MRATEIDKVVVYDCFRPGDVVRAEVLSLGDARSYYLTTAKVRMLLSGDQVASGLGPGPTSFSCKANMTEPLSRSSRGSSKPSDILGFCPAADGLSHCLRECRMSWGLCGQRVLQVCGRVDLCWCLSKTFCYSF